MTPQEFLDQVYESSDKDYGIFPPPISDDKGLDILIKHFLRDDWYSVNPISRGQVNVEAIYEILQKYPNAEQEKEKRSKRNKDKVDSILCKIRNISCTIIDGICNILFN